LVGEDGDDTLDGGTGADIISTGAGSDTIVIRSGDGGATQSDGDTIETYDGYAGFTDGTDSFGLDGITFTELTIEQSGNDTVIKEGSNFLATLKGISASNITILDFQSADSSNQTLNGDSSDNTILGGSGNDTINGGAGSDTLYGWGGDDTFNIRSKSGAYSDFVNGGAGTDTLDIDYSGITSLMSFDIATLNTTTTLTDSNGGSIAYEIASMENLTVNSIDYTKVTNENTYWNAAQDTLIAYSSMATSSSDITGLTGFSASDNLTIVGSDTSDSVEFNIDRSSAFTANLTLNTKGGTDEVLLAQLKNNDSIDLGAGDDLIWLKFTGSNGTPAVAAADLTKLDGGAGTDTMNFNFTGNNTSELNLTTGGATNFENITGSPGGETIKGDGNVNVLKGGHSNPSGSDTIYGYGGNDILWAGGSNVGASTNTLYGGAGNDRLVGEDGDDTLDGGTGADIISTGAGSDTIVIRSGDGGASITDADTVETYDGYAGFTDGSDIIGLDGLQYSELTVEQGTGSYSGDVIIKITATGEFLIVIKGVSVSSITSADFNAI
jgi:Ca2+-binding RTX toxin-like protein